MVEHNIVTATILKNLFIIVNNLVSVDLLDENNAQKLKTLLEK